jgi:hypothetical protein
MSVQNITTTAAELATNIAYYEDLAKAGKLGSIALSDPNNFSPITSVLGLAEYQKVLALLQAPSSIADAYASFKAGTLTNAVLIDATSSSIMANLANLASMSSAGFISGIVVNDASTSTSILNVGADSALAADNARMLGAAGITQFSVATGSISLSSIEVAALAKAGITFKGEYSISIADTAVNIATNIDVIQSVISNESLVFTDITVTDTNPITITQSQLSADAAALALLSGSYALAVSNVLAGDAVSILNANCHVTSISIVDSSIHLAANLDALELVNSSISSIVVTDPNALSLTSQQLTNDSSILAKVNGLFDGSSGSATFSLSPNPFGAISDTHCDIVTGWGGSDTISYSNLLTIGGSATSPIAGQAQINQTTGIASFNASDSTLAQQITAIEHSLATTGALAGQFAEWVNGGNTYVLIADGHAGVVNPSTGIEAGDVLIKLVGISDPSHVALSQGTLIAH